MEVSLEEDEVIVSLDVKSLYTNVPVLESIELAADILYNSEELPPVDKETFKDLMRMAVTDVYFLCDGRWYRWFHLKCTNLTIRQLKGMDDNYWNCGCGAVSSRPKAKVFGRYVDDILRLVKAGISIQYQYIELNINNFHSISISISNRMKFQYQYQYQYLKAQYLNIITILRYQRPNSILNFEIYN